MAQRFSCRSVGVCPTLAVHLRRSPCRKPSRSSPAPAARSGAPFTCRPTSSPARGSRRGPTACSTSRRRGCGSPPARCLPEGEQVIALSFTPPGLVALGRALALRAGGARRAAQGGAERGDGARVLDLPAGARDSSSLRVLSAAGHRRCRAHVLATASGSIRSTRSTPTWRCGRSRSPRCRPAGAGPTGRATRSEPPWPRRSGSLPWPAGVSLLDSPPSSCRYATVRTRSTIALALIGGERREPHAHPGVQVVAVEPDRVHPHHLALELRAALSSGREAQPQRRAHRRRVVGADEDAHLADVGDVGEEEVVAAGSSPR